MTMLVMTVRRLEDDYEHDDEVVVLVAAPVMVPPRIEAPSIPKP